MLISGHSDTIWSTRAWVVRMKEYMHFWGEVCMLYPWVPYLTAGMSNLLMYVAYSKVLPSDCKRKWHQCSHRWNEDCEFAGRGSGKFIQRRVYLEVTGGIKSTEGDTRNRAILPEVHAITVSNGKKEENINRPVGKEWVDLYFIANYTILQYPQSMCTCAYRYGEGV